MWLRKLRLTYKVYILFLPVRAGLERQMEVTLLKLRFPDRFDLVPDSLTA